MHTSPAGREEGTGECRKIATRTASEGRDQGGEHFDTRHMDNDNKHHMDVSKNKGTPKSSILIGFSIINHPFWGTTIFGNTHIIVLDRFILLKKLLGTSYIFYNRTL